MSMLQQILDQMFVDPEILDALDEEQKQILFIKMREEQVKRWKAFEEKCEREGEPLIRKAGDGSRRIRWLKGADGKDWVWVMGEHKDDLTIEQITERRACEEARKLAEKETLENLRLTELNIDYIPMVGPNEDENTLKEQLSRMEPWNCTAVNSKIQESMYEDANTLFDSPFNNGTMQGSSIANSCGEIVPKSILKHSDSDRPDNTRIEDSSHNQESNDDSVSSQDIISHMTIHPNKTPMDLAPNTSSDTDLMQCILSLKQMDSNHVSNAPSHSTVLIETPSDKSFRSMLFDQRSSIDSADTCDPSFASQSSTSFHQNSGLDKEVKFTPGAENAQSSSSLTCEQMGLDISPTTVSSEISFISGNHSSQSKNTETSTSYNSNAYVRTKPSQQAKISLLSEIDEEISKRQSEILAKIKEKHEQFDREAEQEAKRVELAWEEQERKAREAEAQIRRIAQKAREQHRRQCLRTSQSVLPVLTDANDPPLCYPRPPKPESRVAIINWFKDEELKNGAGIDPLTNEPAVWFHGIISRSHVDELLKNKPSGSYLVRVSERIWGYTVSYAVGDGTVKHFLIEKVPQGYQFLGRNQVVHNHLCNLVAYHEIAPITRTGNEILRWAVGQIGVVPDYADLIPA